MQTETHFDFYDVSKDFCLLFGFIYTYKWWLVSMITIINIDKINNYPF